MPKINFVLNNGKIKQVQAVSGISLMEVAHQNNIYEIEGACGGALSCATCHVIIHENYYDTVEKIMPKKDDEEGMLDFAFNITKTSRLSCQIIIDHKLDGLIVKIP